ncbi:hypothetical protein EIP91_006609 [Steccherinum ochraceum]|uniref:Uncharacterized protein n=1 Tax=Steccherinum ochraceum TaxID=92696 RepID=A0A4R0RB83_9APHY|nr:hypothetical protein EIP91_006609 [Steccherinum ochraceum]
MDAPQISTLPEEGSPEPQVSARTVPKPPRVKLRLSEGKPPVASTSSSLPKQIARNNSDDDEEDEDDDDEEDQLIDDDDDDVRPPPAPTAKITIPVTLPPPPPTTPATASTRGGTAARRGVEAGARATITVPPMINSTVEGWNANVSALSAASTPSTTGRKRGGPGSRGGVAQRAVRKRGGRGAKGIPAVPRDDAGSISEAYAGTAASSPMPHEEHSPEPFEIHNTSLLVPAPVDIDMNLEGVPLPVYPLPSKPFPVQPPPKIATGIAPPTPLDKSGKPVRRWRQANREIRGIAGGRWFTKAWIGDKESDFASAQAAASVALQNAAVLHERDPMGVGLGGVLLPSLSAISMPGTGKSTPRGKAAKAALGHATAQSSRAASIVPESISAQFPPAKRPRLHAPVSTPGFDTPGSISTPGP